MTGALTIAGAPEVTGPTDAVATLTDPYALLAVTVTRTRAPRSGVPST
jgi:hypothetical protein